MSRHEAPEVGAAILRMMNGLIRRAAAGDTEAIEALYVIEGMAPHATNAALAVANNPANHPQRVAYSYGFLADVTGTSRAAVQQRVGRASAAAALTECGHLTCLGMRRCRERVVHRIDPDAVGDRAVCGARGVVVWGSSGRVTCKECA